MNVDTGGKWVDSSLPSLLSISDRSVEQSGARETRGGRGSGLPEDLSGPRVQTPPPPTTAQLPAPSGHQPQDAWPWGREAGQYLAIRGSSSNMVSSTLR